MEAMERKKKFEAIFFQMISGTVYIFQRNNMNGLHVYTRLELSFIVPI